MKKFSHLLGNQKILPIIQAQTVDEGVAIARAMQQGGLNLVEVVLRSEASLAAISAIKKQLPELIVGAGTVTSKEVLSHAVEAGADFIVTPAISPSLLASLSQVELPILPGVSNTADILLATEHGFDELKLFPANLSGGAPFIKAVSSVFPGVRFCPTGGVNQQNLPQYTCLDNVLAVGGTWMCEREWVLQSQWHEIAQACRAANN